MKPSTFPDRIDEIVALINSGGGTGGGGGGSAEVTYRHYSGSFLAASDTQTVPHNCGEVPDILIVSLDDVPTTGTVFFATGFSQAMLDNFGGGYLNAVNAIAPGGGAISAKSNKGIEHNDTGAYGQYGGLRNVSAADFTVGGSNFGLNAGSYYSYVAICGLA